jgi:hypothetical protein
MTTIRTKSLRKILTVSGAIALAAGLVVAAAPAGAFQWKASKTIIVPKFQKGAVSAKCPAGQVVGFGGLVAEYHHGASTLYPTGMRKTAAGQWTAYGQSMAPTRGSQLTSIAYCSAVGPTQVVENTVSVLGHHVGSAVATCPVGTVVVAGGFNTRGIPHFAAMKGLERIADDQWRATIVNVNQWTTTITSIAYCGPGPAPIMVSGQVNVPANSGATARATCPLGTELLFGGHTATVGVGDHLPHILPFGFQAETTTRWGVAAKDVNKVPGKVTALAYCR